MRLSPSRARCRPTASASRASRISAPDARCVFRLESGFVTTTGASASSSTFFNRQAYVGLSDPMFGTLTLGRQTDWNFDWLGSVSTGQLLGDFSAFHPGNLDGLGSTLPVQLSSTVKWKSANYSGLTSRRALRISWRGCQQYQRTDHQLRRQLHEWTAQTGGGVFRVPRSFAAAVERTRPDFIRRTDTRAAARRSTRNRSAIWGSAARIASSA